MYQCWHCCLILQVKHSFVFSTHYIQSTVQKFPLTSSFQRSLVFSTDLFVTHVSVPLFTTGHTIVLYNWHLVAQDTLLNFTILSHNTVPKMYTHYSVVSPLPKLENVSGKQLKKNYLVLTFTFHIFTCTITNNFPRMLHPHSLTTSMIVLQGLNLRRQY